MYQAQALPQDFLNQPPFILRWNDSTDPLPRRAIYSPPTKRRNHPLFAAVPWIDTGPRHKPFDFSDSISWLCSDVISKCDAFSHIDCSRLLFAVTQARNNFAHGLQARVTPMRFAGGRLTDRRRDIVYLVQRFASDDVEFLYLVTFCLPRYLNQDFEGKMVTLFHELYHISAQFDGDLRRHNGRYCVHTHSQKKYDEKMSALVKDYLANDPHHERFDFLRLDFSQLEQRHGSVRGIVVPRPKILPVIPSRTTG